MFCMRAGSLHRWQGLFLLLVTALSWPTTSRGALLMHDPFLTGGNAANGEYTAGNNLPGQNPAITNTNGPWILAGGQDGGTVSIRPTATPLSFGSYPAAGGSLEVYRSSNGTNTDPFSFSRPAANNAASTLNAGDSFYFSGLVGYTSTSRRAGIGLDFEGGTNFGIGFNNAGALTFFSNDAAVTTGQLAGYTAGTYLLVGKVTPNPTPGALETISILLATTNPSGIPTSEPVPLTTLDLNVWEAGTGDTLDNFWLYAQKTSGTNVISGRFDEFRVASSYADVVAIPEPSLLLTAASFFLLIGIGWRMR